MDYVMLILFVLFMFFIFGGYHRSKFEAREDQAAKEGKEKESGESKEP